MRKINKKILSAALLSVMCAGSISQVYSLAAPKAEHVANRNGYVSYMVGNDEYVKMSSDYKGYTGPINSNHRSNVPVIARLNQPKRDYSKDFEYNYTLKFVDFETGKVVKTIDGETHHSHLPQITSAMMPLGYSLDYLTAYSDDTISADSDVIIFVRKNRFVRMYDKDGNLISTSSVNRFIDWYRDDIPKAFKAPTLSFDGFRPEGNYFVKDFVLDEMSKSDISKKYGSDYVRKYEKAIDEMKNNKSEVLKERADKEKARVNSIISDDFTKFKTITDNGRKSDSKIADKLGVNYIKEEDKSEINKNVPVTVTYEFFDEASGNKVGENIYTGFRGEKFELKGVPYGFENVSYKEDKDNYLMNTMKFKVIVKRVKSVDDLIKYNDKNAPKMLKTDDSMVKAYDIVTNSNSSEEYYMRKYPHYTDAIKQDGKDFVKMTESEKLKTKEDKTATDKKKTTYDKRLNEKEDFSVNVVANLDEKTAKPVKSSDKKVEPAKSAEADTKAVKPSEKASVTSDDKKVVVNFDDSNMDAPTRVKFVSFINDFIASIGSIFK